MELQITPGWITNLRRDLVAWDRRVEEARESWRMDGPWGWPDITPPLKYTDCDGRSEFSGRKRRMSTGTILGSGRHPPSEVHSHEFERRVKMQMRFPKHVWAMISRGREAESVEIQQAMLYGWTVKGVGIRDRWQEDDGEHSRNWEDEDGVSQPRKWTEWYVRRMKWAIWDNTWRGEWQWEVYDRDVEWDDDWKHQHTVLNSSSISSNARWASAPQEVLLSMVRGMEVDGDENALATASRVCHAWYAVCAPELYHTISVYFSRAKELSEALSKPDSLIAQYCEKLSIRGPVPWLALTKLIKSIPRLTEVTIADDGEHTCYHPTAPRSLSTIHGLSQTTLILTSLFLDRQWFASTADLLWLLACLPSISSVILDGCAIQSASATAPRVMTTRLTELQVSRTTGIIHERAIPALALWWQWPHATESATLPFPGLHRADARAVFDIMRSISFGTLKWQRVRLSLLEPRHPGTWVLLTEILSGEPTVTRLDTPDRCMELELHVAFGPPTTAAEARAPPSARVEHVVVRMNVLETKLRNFPHGDMLESMEVFLTQLPSLSTVTLETPDAGGYAGLEERLPVLRAGGKVRLRTCREAQQLAQAANHNAGEYSGDQGALSPLWYPDDERFSWERQQWLNLVDANPDQGEPASVKLPADAAEEDDRGEGSSRLTQAFERVTGDDETVEAGSLDGACSEDGAEQSGDAGAVADAKGKGKARAGT